MSSASRINLNGAARSYGRHEALLPLTLDLPASFTLGLLGPNGAGKSTLMSLMACVLPVSRGEVRIDGVSITSQRAAREAQLSIGFLRQKPSWIPSFTAMETVLYSAWLKSVPRRHRSERASHVLDKVGLSTVSRKRMKELSGGMIQRVCLAAEMVNDPKILILDEPTVGLDPAQRLEFRSLISNLTDATVVLSTHLVEDVAIMADRILVMQEGEIMFSGSPTQLEAKTLPDAPGDTIIERAYMSILGSLGGGSDQP